MIGRGGAWPLRASLRHAKASEGFAPRRKTDERVMPARTEEKALGAFESALFGVPRPRL